MVESAVHILQFAFAKNKHIAHSIPHIIFQRIDWISIAD